jgi:hypothetical protein
MSVCVSGVYVCTCKCVCRFAGVGCFILLYQADTPHDGIRHVHFLHVSSPFHCALELFSATYA